MQSGLKKIIKKPSLLFLTLGHRGFFNWMPDEMYIKIAYRIKMGKKLNLSNPTTFNEKLQWLKLYNHRPEYTMMVDKYEVKKYVADMIGEQYVIPTLGVWNHFDEIDFDKLPKQFVLKCTHDSGGLVICRDKEKLNKSAAKRKLERCLKHNFYYGQREWPYKDVKPRIIAEEYLELNKVDCAEYKMFCFEGKVKIVLVCKGEAHADKVSVRTNDFYDVDFNHIPVKILNENSREVIKRPEEFEKLKSLAESLSKNIPVVRVDFYLVDNKIYFGELTFFHNSGFNKFEPELYDKIWGSYIIYKMKHEE
jgi:hypothetical protein